MRQVVQEIDDFAKANPDKPNAAKMGDQLKNLLEGTLKDQLEDGSRSPTHRCLGMTDKSRARRESWQRPSWRPHKRDSTS